MRLSEMQKSKFFEKVYKWGDVYILKRVDTDDEDFILIDKEGKVTLYWVDTLKEANPYKSFINFINKKAEIQLFKMNDKKFVYKLIDLEV